MASYDSQLRHHDSTSHRSRDLDPYYRPRHAHDDRHEPSRHRHRSSTRETTDKYLSEDHYSRQRDQPRRARSSSFRPARSRTRDRWPPSPFVEDEVKSVAREYGPKRLLGRGDEPPMRGTIEQEPMLIDLAAPVTEERWGKRSGYGSNSKGSLRTDARKGTRDGYTDRRKAPTINTDCQNTPDLSRRQPSPYSFKPNNTTTTTKRSSAEYFLSPEAITPRSTFSRPDTTANGRSTGSRRNADGSHFSSGSHSASSSQDDSDSGHSEPTRDSDRKPSRYSFVKSELNRTNLRTSLHEVAEENDQRSGYSTTNRNDRTGKTAEGFHRSEKDGMRSSQPRDRLPPDSGSKYHIDGNDSAYGSSSSHRYDLRSSSPAVSDHSPPSSLPRSRPGSRGESRVPSSLASSLGAAAAGAGVAAFASHHRHGSSEHTRHNSSSFDSVDQTRRAGRADSTVRKDSVHDYKPPLPPRVDVQSPSPARFPRTPTRPYSDDESRDRISSPLPYPDDDMPSLMPCEERFQFGPSSPDVPVRQPSFAPQIPSHSAQRPNARRTVSDTPKTPTRTESRRSKEEGHREDPNQAAQEPKPLPPCPRPEYTNRYNDWYALSGHSHFDICPSCFDDVFATTEHARHFARAPRKPADAKTKCHFSNAWVRLAWLLTLKQQRRDLELVHALARVAAAEPACPGEHEAHRAWHGLRDDYGDVVAGFHVCPADARNVEALFPSLRNGAGLTRLPRDAAARLPQLCSLRTSAGQFSLYLDALVDIDDAASHSRTRTAPDLRPLIALIRARTQRPPACPRDNLVVGNAWHVIPALLPAFTVCEACYADVVRPSLAGGSALAAHVSRAAQYVPGETGDGTSCQLYSPRMRRVWRNAVQDGDLRYLEKRAAERKRIEMNLQSQMRVLTKMAEGRGGGDGDWSSERVRDEVRRITEEWKEWE